MKANESQLWREKIEQFKDWFKDLPHTRIAYRILLGLVAIPLVIMLFVFLLVYSGTLGRLPHTEDLRTIRTEIASEVYSVDNKILGKYYIKNRSQTVFAELAPHLVDALIATEDSRFYEHSGVDMPSMFRVAFKSILLQNSSSGGGSTISQQLARNLYPRQRYSFLSLAVNKFQEMIIARRLEKVYSKEELLVMYLNTVSFGDNSFGIEVASRRFFNTTPSELQVEEAATLVGMLKGTTIYNPRLYPERAFTRRNVVLSQMKKYGYLEETKADSLQQIALELNYTYLDHNSGPAPYFREYLRMWMDNWCKKSHKSDGSNYNLYTDGLKIYTTIDSRLQRYAEEAVYEQMKTLQKSFDRYRPNYKTAAKSDMIKQAMKRSPRYISMKRAQKSEAEIMEVFTKPISMTLYSWEGPFQKEFSPLDSIIYYHYFLHAGLLSVEPENGSVRAWVGGINHRYFQYDHIHSKRQVGSTFKPIVYAAALEVGKTPCDYISNDKVEFTDYDNWSPRNSDNDYGGEYSLKGALTHSVNVVSVNLMMQTGITQVVDQARKLGIDSKLPAVPSLALGSADLSLYEMVNAYCSLTNGGYAIEPAFILRIEDKEGNILFKQKESRRGDRVLSPSTSEQITHMMRNVVNYGTGAGLRSRYGIHTDIAGKTGTTQDQADGWFIGSTPRLVTGTWVGAEDRRVHFRSLRQGQGARTAMPIWASFMKKVYADRTFRKFKQAKFPPLSSDSYELMSCEDRSYLIDLPDFQYWWQYQREMQNQRDYIKEIRKRQRQERRRRFFQSIIPEKLRRNN